MADNDFWSPGEKVLSGTELSDAKGQIPQGEISTRLCNISLKLQEKQKQFAQSKLNFYSEDFNCFFLPNDESFMPIGLLYVYLTICT